MKLKVEENSYLRGNLPDFDIDQIANSGQCFRISQVSSNKWQIVAMNKILLIHQEGEDCVFECSKEEFYEIWYDYFDLQRDYGKIKEAIRATKDPYLIAAVEYGHGIRILKQDLWEIIITFIISQRNNIPRIKNIIKKLCEPHGKQFPTPNILEKYDESLMDSLKLGYRAQYIKDIAKAVVNGDLNLQKLKEMTYSDAINFLKNFNGIGNKVANCIALFGLHKVEAFPIDVWIKRVIDNRYDGNFDVDRFKGYAGIVQQYMFFYEKNHATKSLENSPPWIGKTGKD